MHITTGGKGGKLFMGRRKKDSTIVRAWYKFVKCRVRRKKNAKTRKVAKGTPGSEARGPRNSKKRGRKDTFPLYFQREGLSGPRLNLKSVEIRELRWAPKEVAGGRRFRKIASSW